ncbi:MAG: hypothetical protein P1U89_25520 [Verrucomicrobiales bacterium]|nr:hypothetical protein [Verrucomicrobiales bacterium]
MNHKQLHEEQEKRERQSDPSYAIASELDRIAHSPRDFIASVREKRDELLRGNYRPIYAIPFLSLTPEQLCEVTLKTTISNLLIFERKNREQVENSSSSESDEFLSVSHLACAIGKNCRELRKKDVSHHREVNVKELFERKGKYKDLTKAWKEIKENLPVNKWKEKDRDVYLGAILIHLFEATQLIRLRLYPIRSYRSEETEVHRLEFGDVEVKQGAPSTPKKMWIVERGRDFENFLGSKGVLSTVAHLPMLVQPKSWEVKEAGGFLTALPRPLIPAKYNHLPQPKGWAISNSFREAVNSLQNTEWTFSYEQLELMKKCLDCPDNEIRDKCKEDKVQFFLNIEKEMGRNKHPNFYFPYHFDYRGRVYSSKSFLQPQGSDTEKSLLQFSEGKEMTDKGVEWLKIHVGNQFGIRGPFDDRIKWVEDNESEIILCSKDPVKNRRWLEAAKPWCFLRAAIELRHLSEGKLNQTHLPVGVDGTCNGLQHIAALSRDNTLGKLTNLIPSDVPNDIYKSVADAMMVNRFSASIIEEIGKFIDIDRRFTKAATMTIPYGIGRSKVTEKYASMFEEQGLNKYRAKNLAKTISPVVWEAIDSTLGNTVFEIQGWLQKVAKSVSESGQPIDWETPCGFRFVQRIVETNESRKKINDIPFSFTLRKRVKKFSASEQKQKIFPNLIHALDASHMIGTVHALQKRKKHRSFCMIHDDFRTHAPNMPELNEVLREEFIRIYDSKNLLAEFVETQRGRCKSTNLPDPPSLGELDISQVQNSDYFFS